MDTYYYGFIAGIGSATTGSGIAHSNVTVIVIGLMTAVAAIGLRAYKLAKLRAKQAK